MIKIIYKARAYLSFLGVDLKVGAGNVKNLGWFFKDKKELKKQLAGNSDFPFGLLSPVLHDKFDTGGKISGQYFHQDLLVAQKIFTANPVKHVDIASRIDGFVAHVAAFRNIEIFDIRPISSTIDRIIFRQVDFTGTDFELTDYTDSISCLHAIEHFGLGRYNDPVDAFGHIKGLDNIYMILKKGGKFYLSTPIGKQRIEFNAQRVFNVSYLLKLFEQKYQIDSFCFVDDNGDLHKDVDLSAENIDNNFGCYYGCGIFELTKV